MSFRDQFDRSPDRNRTSSDTSDPHTARRRIFIGGLVPGVTRNELEEKFAAYGRVVAVSLLKGFGFVQYEDEDSATKAITGENGTQFKGKRLDVNFAKTPNTVGGGGERNDHAADRGREKDHIRERSPLHDRDREWGRFEDRYPNWSDVSQRDVDPYLRSRYAQDDHFDRYRDRFMDDSYYRGTYRNDPYTRSTDPFMPTTTSRVTTESSPRVPAATAPTTTQEAERPNDCEIIVLGKENTDYAEGIESRLKNLGLMVDLLFPNEDIPLGKVLANISSKGCLFAVVVSAQNVLHRSLTLNILFGQPQEHRNMPLDDAMNLIARSFEQHIQAKRDDSVKKVSSGTGVPGNSGTSGRGPIPENIQMLLNLLADNRQLTVMEYDRVIKYLQEKREKQCDIEGGDPKMRKSDLPSGPGGTSSSTIAAVAAEKPFAQQQAELQQRILNILNSGSESGATLAAQQLGSVPSSVPAPAGIAPPVPLTPMQTTPTTSAPILNNPTVQKALDSLIQTGPNLLKNMPASNTGQGTGPTAAAAATIYTPSASGYSAPHTAYGAPTQGYTPHSMLGQPPATPLFGAYGPQTRY